MRARIVIAAGVALILAAVLPFLLPRRPSTEAPRPQPTSTRKPPRAEEPPGGPVEALRHWLQAGPTATEPVEDVFERLARAAAPPTARRLYLTLYIRKHETVPLMAARLRSGTTEEKALVISLLARYFFWPEPAPLVAAVADDPREPDKLRLRALYAAHCLGYPASAATAVHILERTDEPLIRELALDLIGTLETPSAASACRPFLRDPSPRVRLKAAKALAGLGDEHGMETAATFLHHEDWVLRKMAAQALGARHSERAAARLTARLAVETDPSVRAAAEQAMHDAKLRDLPEDERVAYLESLVGADEWVGRWALEQLFREHRPAALPALRRLARRRDRHGHAAAVYALLLEGAPSAG